MGKATLLVVDDNADELHASERELRKRYNQDYDILSERSPGAALDTLAALKAEGIQVAILFADLWMSEMTGIEFLKRAHDLHPTAKRALLTTWGDSTARGPILQAATFGWIDNYTGKPIAEPDERFHRLVTETLEEWSRQHQPEAVLVRIVANRWSARSYELRDLLSRYGIPFRFDDVDSEEGQALLQQVDQLHGPFPVIVLFDGRVFTDPSNETLADALGVGPTPSVERVDVMIIGSGPAGLSAAVYAASEGLQTLVIEQEAIGGQAGTSPLIRNYLGFPMGISGAELATRAYNQAWLFGAQFQLLRRVTGLRADGSECVAVLADGTEIVSRALVLALGASYRRLEIPTLEALVGAGVFYGGAVTEAQAMGGQAVFVAGAGNSAGQAAVHLSRYAKQVTILVRGDSLAAHMSDYLVKEVDATENIDVRLNTVIVDGTGTHRLEGLVLQNTVTGETVTVRAAALFVLIGAQPHTEWLPANIACDQGGYIVTGQDILDRGYAWSLERAPLRLETCVPGVFAVGDARCRSVKRIAAAVGEGGTVIQLVHEFLSSQRK